MRILIVECDPESLEDLRDGVDALQPGSEIVCCESSLNALAEARQAEFDVAFIEAEMPELNGLDLGEYLRELQPMVNLIYLHPSRDYGYDALLRRASGYILTPATTKSIRRELEALRHPPADKQLKRVYAQTFGSFELFCDGQPVQFKYSKTKEIVALLINNRGAQTTNGEIIASLWEDEGDPEKKSSYLSNLRQDLQNTMNRLKLNGLILKQRGSMAIAADKIECDLFDWLSKKKASKYHYLGEYMNQYSWAEYIHAELDELSYALEDE